MIANVLKTLQKIRICLWMEEWMLDIIPWYRGPSHSTTSGVSWVSGRGVGGGTLLAAVCLQLFAAVPGCQATLPVSHHYKWSITQNWTSAPILKYLSTTVIFSEVMLNYCFMNSSMNWNLEMFITPWTDFERSRDPIHRNQTKGCTSKICTNTKSI